MTHVAMPFSHFISLYNILSSFILNCPIQQISSHPLNWKVGSERLLIFCVQWEQSAQWWLEDCSCIKFMSYEFNNIGYFCNLTSNIRNWSAQLSNFRSLNQNSAIPNFHSHQFCLLSLQVIHHWSQNLLYASRKGVRRCLSTSDQNHK